jgi:Zn-dependent protease with chaperone function
MSYDNPDVPHDVNVSRDSPLAEFARLAAGLAVVIVVLAIVLNLAGGWLARRVPFSVEQRWAGDRAIGLALGAPTAVGPATERYLQSLADELAAPLALSPGMTVRLHFTELDVPNAFATLAGHIVVTSGLYDRMPSENALAAVIAHEIGHVRARDPISALGAGASLAVVLALLGGDVDGLAPALARVVQLGYSRSAETRADEVAVQALRAHYGHAGGAAAVFEVLAGYTADRLASATPSLLSTHPADDDRIARLREAASDWNAARDPLRPLPARAPAGTERSEF